MLTRSRSFGMGLFIEKRKQQRRLVSSRLVSLYCLNPARPSAPSRHTRQRIKPSLCRLGIQSEQTSDTHQLAAAPASRRHRPRSARCSSGAANRIRKKEQRRRRLARVYEVKTCTSRRRFRCRFNALAIFRIARAAEDRPAQSRRRFRCRFNALATITAPRLRPAVGDRPLARPAASADGASRKKNPARPSAPSRHTRQRIKPSLCRLGIQSEQTSDTHQLAAAPASRRHRPRRLLQRSPPTGFAKKNSGDAASRACMKKTCASRRRFRCRFNALAIFRIARAAEDRPAQSRRRFRCRSIHSQSSPRRRSASGRRPPLARPAASANGASRKKNPARPSAPSRHTRQRIKAIAAGSDSRASRRPITISSPRRRPAVGIDPVARPAASAAGELCKKKNPRGARRRPL